MHNYFSLPLHGLQGSKVTCGSWIGIIHCPSRHILPREVLREVRGQGAERRRRGPVAAGAPPSVNTSTSLLLHYDLCYYYYYYHYYYYYCYVNRLNYNLTYNVITYFSASASLPSAPAGRCHRRRIRPGARDSI